VYVIILCIIIHEVHVCKTQIKMELSKVCRKRRRRALVLANLTFIGCMIFFCVIFYFIRNAAFKDNHYSVYLQRQIADQIRTARDTLYVLYGEGESDANTDNHLHNYIRSTASRHTLGERRQAGHPGRLHYSQHGQSEYVDKLLKRRRNGVFLEAGAADGEALSNSLFFELHRNWTGILMEANPIRVKHLITRNRDAFVVPACLSVTTTPQVVKFTMTATGKGGAISSNINRGIWKAFKYYAKSEAFGEVYVQCFPLMSVAAALNIQHIDYFSLDVEGAEVPVLKTIDWKKLTIDVITIEYNHQKDILQSLRTLFNETGLYKEVGLMPVGTDETRAIDVVFMRR